MFMRIRIFLREIFAMIHYPTGFLTPLVFRKLLLVFLGTSQILWGNTATIGGHVIDFIEQGYASGEYSVYSVTPKSGDIVIPSTFDGGKVVGLGEGLFRDGVDINSVVVQEGTRFLGSYVFSNCSHMVRLSLPASLQDFGIRPFDNCVNIKDVTLPGQFNDIWLPKDDHYNYFAEEAFPSANVVTNLFVAEGSKSINDRYVENWSALECVTIPCSVTNIGLEAFSNCTKLKNVIIADGVQVFSGLTFQHCSSLRSIMIPQSVKSMGENVFKGCYNLTNITFEGNAPACPRAIFTDASNDLVIRVPYGSKGWNGDPESTELPKLWPHNNSSGRPIIHIGDELPVVESSPSITNYVMVTNMIYSSVTNMIFVEHWVTNCLTITNVVHTKETINHYVHSSVTNTIYTTVTNEVNHYIGGTVTNNIYTTVTNVVNNHSHETVTNITIISEAYSELVGGEVSVDIVDFTPEPGFIGDSKNCYNGIIYDTQSILCGLVQITTSKASKKGVKVGGFIMLADGKKVALKAALGTVENGYLTVTTKVGKLGETVLTIGKNGFKGQLGNLSLSSADVGEDTGVLSGTTTLKYFDAAKGKLTSKKIVVAGMSSEGVAIGTVTPKNAPQKAFTAELK